MCLFSLRFADVRLSITYDFVGVANFLELEFFSSTSVGLCNIKLGTSF